MKALSEAKGIGAKARSKSIAILSRPVKGSKWTDERVILAVEKLTNGEELVYLCHSDDDIRSIFDQHSKVEWRAIDKEEPEVLHGFVVVWDELIPLERALLVTTWIIRDAAGRIICDARLGVLGFESESEAAIFIKKSVWCGVFPSLVNMAGLVAICRPKGIRTAITNLKGDYKTVSTIL
jgi:hypothetical protein